MTTTTTAAAGYYNRGATPYTSLCEPCGVKRWGDPFTGDGSDAFNARYDDSSGDWCWDPTALTTCAACGTKSRS